MTRITEGLRQLPRRFCLLLMATLLMPLGLLHAATYEAEASGNTIAGSTKISTCSACSGGHKVGFIGNGSGNFVTINNINVSSAGSYTVTISYLVNGTRSFSVSVNGGSSTTLSLSGSSFSNPVTTTMTVNLNSGNNTMKFGNSSAFAPDLDKISVASSGGGGGTTNSHVYVTLYGWPDNSPPGNAIAYPKNGGYPTIHNGATAGGSFSNPSTFASDAVDGEFKVGQVIYYPTLQKYFINEDECTGSGPPIAGTGNCEADWQKLKEYHIDLWLGGNPPANTNSVLNCEDKWTTNGAVGTIIVNPDGNRTVNTAPIFDSNTNKCQ